MPMYEGLSSLGLINEKHTTVIFDFGHAFTKLGFAGETCPRAIVRSEVKCRKSGKNVPVFEYNDEVQLRHQIIDFIYILYFRNLLVNPKDRRVVIIEDILGSTLIKETLSNVLFRHYEVTSLLFMPSHLACLTSLGINTALVLDIGYKEASLIPIFEGVVILDAWQSLPLGSKSIYDSLSHLLVERAICSSKDEKEQRFSAAMDSLPERVCEDILVRCCFVSTLERKDRLFQNKYDRSVEPPPPPPSVQYNLDGNYVLTIPGTVREMACEVLFESDEDKLSLAQMFLNSLLKCPIDARSKLAENTVIIGGMATIVGMKHRILHEINILKKEPLYADKSKIAFKIHSMPAKDNYAAWLGGSILGCTEAVSLRSVSRDAYLQNCSMPDWSNLAFNLKEERNVG